MRVSIFSEVNHLQNKIKFQKQVFQKLNQLNKSKNKKNKKKKMIVANNFLIFIFIQNYVNILFF